ncbi:MAG TPA: DUF58 domain-containing protein [Candidatus Limnocylindria bacterium]|nr:DUF58 domain-containing protein [Candidatus Limnocylindria bacterium]
MASTGGANVVPVSPAPEVTLQRLDWTVLRRLDGLLQGDYRTLFYGQGLDLADIREYQPEDDVRYIDWNVTARMDTPYVRQYHEDREITAHFLCDLSPSLDFGTVRTEKRAVVEDVVAVLSRILTRHGNRVGAILYNGSVERAIPAGGGKPAVLRLLNEIRRSPRLRQAPYTALADLIEAADRTIRRRSLIFVVSDFFSAPGWERALGRLAMRNEVIAVRVSDPREREIPDIGWITMTDAETGQQLQVDTHDRRFRTRFAQVVQKHEEALRRAFVQAGVDVLEVSTEEDLVRAIARFAAVRKLRRGRH